MSLTTKAVIPETYDWRLYGAVSPVKDQAICGSCWAFAAAGALEGAYFLKNGGNLIRFSEQSMTDCSWDFDNRGCSGGTEHSAFDWVQKVGGVPTDLEYGSYLGIEGYCHVDNVTLIAPITGYVNVPSNDKVALKIAIFKNGPVSVSIDARHRSFAFYSHGVYYEKEW